MGIIFYPAVLYSLVSKFNSVRNDLRKSKMSQNNQQNAELQQEHSFIQRDVNF